MVLRMDGTTFVQDSPAQQGEFACNPEYIQKVGDIPAVDRRQAGRRPEVDRLHGRLTGCAPPRAPPEGPRHCVPGSLRASGLGLGSRRALINVRSCSTIPRLQHGGDLEPVGGVGVDPDVQEPALAVADPSGDDEGGAPASASRASACFLVRMAAETVCSTL